VKKAYLYRLYPSEEQAALLQQQLDVAREVYNACLLERREAYRMAGVTLNLGERWHHCPRCGLSLPRDQVSAMRIKALGLEMLANLANTSGLGSSPQAPTWPAGACVA
jgi:transposase